MKISIPYRESALLSQICKKVGISVMGYPISHSIKDNELNIVSAGFYIGSEEKLKEFEKLMKKDKRVQNLERKGNFGIGYLKQHIVNKILFHPGTFLTKPTIVDKNGVYTFEIAAFEKKDLTFIFNTYKIFEAKLHFIKQCKITNIQIMNLFPVLTEKQKNAMLLAVEHGYYEFPRKVELQELAIIAKSSYSTYQFHLRNAERKVMPHISQII